MKRSTAKEKTNSGFYSKIDALRSRCGRVLKNKKGELLIESLMSIVIFSLLMVTITAIISVSFRITRESYRKTNIAQENANQAIFEKYETTVESNITFKSKGNAIIDATHKIKVLTNDEIVSFVPKG